MSVWSLNHQCFYILYFYLFFYLYVWYVAAARRQRHFNDINADSTNIKN